MLKNILKRKLQTAQSVSSAENFVGRWKNPIHAGPSGNLDLPIHLDNVSFISKHFSDLITFVLTLIVEKTNK